MSNLPNVSPSASRREALSMAIIFLVLYVVVVGLNTGGHYCFTFGTDAAKCFGYALLAVSWLLAIVVTGALTFTLWEWWSDLQSCKRRGLEQNAVTSGVPFMPGGTTQSPK